VDIACPTVDLTFGPLPAPEVAYNGLDGSFWLSWIWENIRIDVSLKDRAALRALTRSCIAASEAEREASHVVTNSG
jgi:hypothetical protein